MSDKSTLAALIAQTTPVYRTNPFWCVEKNFPAHRHSHAPFDIFNYIDLLKVVRQYFRTVYESFNSEAQVLLVTQSDWELLEPYGLPTLNHDTIEGVVIVVLPQVNTFSNTIVSESFWQNVLVKNDIYPLARIHSHHILRAYQSPTDYSSLNSNTLEVVIGGVFHDDLEVAFWLDVHGTDQKANVWRWVQDPTQDVLLNQPVKVPAGRPTNN